MVTTRRPPRQTERAIQAQIVRLLRSIGAAVYVLGTTRRRGDYPGTMQTPGLPDLLAFLPPPPSHSTSHFLWVEVKAARGRLSPEQREFGALCQTACIDHVVGGLDAIIAWLVERGYIREDSLPHYRRAVS